MPQENKEVEFEYEEPSIPVEYLGGDLENCAESEGFEDLDNCINLDESERVCEDIASFFQSDLPILRSCVL